MAEKKDAGEKVSLDLGALLDGVKQTRVEVKVCLDGTIVDNVVAAYDALDSIPEDAEVQSITDLDPTEAAKEAVREALTEMEDASIVFTLRSLSSAEMSTLRARVTREVKVPKNASQDERDIILEERTQKMYEAFLSRSVIKVVNGEAEKTGVSLDEVRRLREDLHEWQWEKLCTGFNSAQTRVKALEETLADPSFRRSRPLD